MTIVSNDPTWWPGINPYRDLSYFIVAAFVVVVYDWALTFGQELELIWRQRWSLMTILYLGVRYLGILYTVLDTVGSVPTITVTDAGCRMLFIICNWASVLAFVMVCVITITRLHAMHQQSGKILIFLIVAFLADNIFNGVVAIMTTIHASGEELILSGTYQCSIGNTEVVALLNSITWVFAIAWEALALCLAAWIAVKHFRELRRHSTGRIIEDCFTVLMKTHLLYFASFVAVSCFALVVFFSPVPSMDQYSLGINICLGVLQILTSVQMFVLGPRLILAIREYYAKLVVDSDAATGMTSIAFQERVHISTGSGV
ncbi:hypothetical protein BDR03DRAFT_963762 [Suillus americanus]|nr:hypothetical protein BDR03DRAFT_963762 [Suillus americanus]